MTEAEYLKEIGARDARIRALLLETDRRKVEVDKLSAEGAALSQMLDSCKKTNRMLIERLDESTRGVNKLVHKVEAFMADLETTQEHTMEMIHGVQSLQSPTRTKVGDQEDETEITRAQTPE